MSSVEDKGEDSAFKGTFHRKSKSFSISISDLSVDLRVLRSAELAHWLCCITLFFSPSVHVRSVNHLSRCL